MYFVTKLAALLAGDNGVSRQDNNGDKPRLLLDESVI